MKRGNLFFKQLIALTIIFSIFSSAFAQTKRGSSGTTKPAVNKSVQKCAGGWSGVVTLKKTLKDSLTSDEPGIRKNIDRIKHNDSRDFKYNASAVIDSSASPNNPTVNAKVNFTDDDKKWGEERVWDTCNARENGHWFIIEGTDNRFTEAKATGSAQDFYLSVDEMSGVYNFNIKFPKAIGTFKREEHVKRSGHCQAKNNEPYDRSTNEPYQMDGESFSINGEKIDPDSPDKLSGSKTWGDDGTGAVRTFVYTATWTFTRCPQKLLITDLSFEDMKFPKWNDWQEINEQIGTIDGNLVKIKATVANLSNETKFAEIAFKETYKGDKWDGAKPDYPLKDSSVSVRLEAGEVREVEVLWNSQGYAWYDDGRPRYLQRIKAEAWEEYKLKDEMTKKLKVSPKPIVFVPGIWTSPKILELYQNLLTVSHSYGWKAAIGKESPSSGPINVEGQTIPTKGGKSVYDKADTLAKYVDTIRKANNAWHVDMAGHSTGGLVARLYVHKQDVLPDNYPVVKHLLMLGTPNLGVPCADSMKLNDAFDGVITTAKEIMPDEIARFNQFVNQRKGTKFSALIGNGSSLLCANIEKSDGFVSVDSAKFGVEDFALTKDSHPDLLEPIHFGEFIKPHLVTGPRGTYPLPVKSEEGGKDSRNAGGN